MWPVKNLSALIGRNNLSSLNAVNWTNERNQSCDFKYRISTTKTRSWFETALNYKPRILNPKIK